jgi:hypothetical protein
VQFRNDIAHPKPELIVEEKVLSRVGLEKTLFHSPKSKLEHQITVGSARRAHNAVNTLKTLLTDALPKDKRFGIYVDVWSGSTQVAE